MASAASRVFAIPELLEEIITHVDEFYDLFTVQRVSRSFKTIVGGTTMLRRKRGLIPRALPEGASQLGEAALSGQIHPLLYPVNKVDFRPYKRRVYDPFDGTVEEMDCKANEPYIIAMEGPEPERVGPGPYPPGLFPWERDDYTHGFELEFLLRPGCTDDKYLTNSSFKLGYTRGHEKDGATHSHGSWRSVRVSLIQKPVWVRVEVLVPRSICSKNGIAGQFLYWEHTLYQDGEVTLGEIVDQLEEVRSRTYEEHFQRREGPDKCHLTPRYRGRYRDDNDDYESDDDSDDADGYGGDERDDENRESDQLDPGEDGDEGDGAEESSEAQKGTERHPRARGDSFW